jgi:hypothetical protein
MRFEYKKYRSFVESTPNGQPAPKYKPFMAILGKQMFSYHV